MMVDMNTSLDVVCIKEDGRLVYKKDIKRFQIA